MIAAWMLWSIGAGLLFLVAGLAVERLLDGKRRWVWVGAGVATVALTAARLLSGGGGRAGVGGAEGVVAGVPPSGTVGAEGVLMGVTPSGVVGAEGGAAATTAGLSPLAVPHDSVLHTLDGILVLGWATLSLGLVVWALLGTADLLHRRRLWEPGTLLGRSVLWARDAGPAVVGFLRPRVVMPAWVSRFDPSEQKLILAHEDEHLRARDAVVRLLMGALVVAFPWNPALWLYHRRLCLAIELDCDRRVLRRLPHRRRLYGDLLLRVGARSGAHHGAAVAAFAERPSFLERRIRGLLGTAPEVRMAQVAFLTFAALLVVGVAVCTPGPTREADEMGEGEDAAEVVEEHLLAPDGDAELSESPQSVAHTVKPQLLNLDEVAAAIEKEYSVLLMDAGVGDTATVHLFVETTGEVANALVKESSRHIALDEVALRVGRVARFSPAMNNDEVVAVWIPLHITYTGNPPPVGGPARTP